MSAGQGCPRLRQLRWRPQLPQDSPEISAYRGHRLQIQESLHRSHVPVSYQRKNWGRELIHQWFFLC